MNVVLKVVPDAKVAFAVLPTIPLCQNKARGEAEELLSTPKVVNVFVPVVRNRALPM